MYYHLKMMIFRCYVVFTGHVVFHDGAVPIQGGSLYRVRVAQRGIGNLRLECHRGRLKKKDGNPPSEKGH